MEECWDTMKKNKQTWIIGRDKSEINDINLIFNMVVVERSPELRHGHIRSTQNIK